MLKAIANPGLPIENFEISAGVLADRSELSARAVLWRVNADLLSFIEA
jgi:hypothetical protein